MTKTKVQDKTKIHIEKGKQEILFIEVTDVYQGEVSLEPDAHLTCITFDCTMDSVTQNSIQAHLQQNAKLEIYNIVTSKASSTITQNIYLDEEGAEVEVMNLLLSTQDAVLDSKIEIFHSSQNTSSSLSNYAIAKDQASITLNNNATIKTACSKSIAHQSTKGLTLSKLAKIKALPNLYIDEYDVIANHACSIGSINKEDLFYLMSRGMTQEEASKIIVMGYVQPILDHIHNQDLKHRIEKEFSLYLLGEK
ncbi:MAG: SufD family Fe-S cluster assembly protein [Prevotella sp.]|nr:SufD family Fe-S cluster assembly protein [Staphylococcus sp.]MCM1350708.1 SufD family Fe-S cluster assembly protein [Prevotella sp.]